MTGDQIRMTDPRSMTSTIPRVAAGAAGLIALAALAGWELDVEWLKNLTGSEATMNPITAASLLIVALALWLAPGGTAGVSSRIARICAMVAVLIGTIRLGGYLLDVDPGLDHLLFRSKIAAAAAPSRMAPQTALCLLLLAAALLLRDGAMRRRLLAGQVAVVGAGMIALMGAVGHAYGGRAAYGAMALSTAVACLVLALGVLWSRPDRGLMRIVLSDSAAGASARRLLILATLILIGLGWLRVLGEDAGLYDSAYGTAAFTIVRISLFVGLILWNAHGLLEAELALKESEDRLFQILDAMPVAVFVLDGAGRPYYANQASQEILGKGIVPEAAPEDLQQVYQTFVAGSDEPYATDRLPIVRALRGERAHITDLEIHRPDRPVPIEVWAAPVFNSAREVAFAIAAFSDITERLRAEAALKHYAAQLEAANAELNAFAYSVSHDLRTPLRSIDGFSRALLDDYAPHLDAKGREYLARVRAAAQRMAELIDDLLALSRVTRSEMKVGPVDLSALAQAVGSDVARAHPSREVEFRVAPSLLVQGDERLLRLALENLLANAWKFTSKQARASIEVGVEVAAGDGQRAYFVRDNGAGFDMAHAEKLFGAFQRLHDAREFEGTGIGLATVQRVIQRHGGRVWADGAPGSGATFSFTLP